MNDEDFKRFYSKSAFCFIRQRVWGFKEISVGILHGLTKGLSVQVDNFVKDQFLKLTALVSHTPLPKNYQANRNENPNRHR
jgi:hypothetical protein